MHSAPTATMLAGHTQLWSSVTGEDLQQCPWEWGIVELAQHQVCCCVEGDHDSLKSNVVGRSIPCLCGKGWSAALPVLNQEQGSTYPLHAFVFTKACGLCLPLHGSGAGIGAGCKVAALIQRAPCACRQWCCSIVPSRFAASQARQVTASAPAPFSRSGR